MKTSVKKASKLVVEITTRELFTNYNASIVDVIWDQDHPDFDDLLAEPLESILREDEHYIRRLFSSGSTMMLLSNAFSELDKHDVIEVIVTKRDGSTFTVANEDVNY
jgi:hypothetical protein